MRGRVGNAWQRGLRSAAGLAWSCPLQTGKHHWSCLGCGQQRGHRPSNQPACSALRMRLALQGVLAGLAPLPLKTVAELGGVAEVQQDADGAHAKRCALLCMGMCT